MNTSACPARFIALEAVCPEDLSRAWSRHARALQGASPALTWHPDLPATADGLACQHADMAQRPAITVLDAGGRWPTSPGELQRLVPPVLVLMAQPGAGQAQAWLEAGADMVVPGEIGPRELEARVRALLRPLRRSLPQQAIRLDLSPPGLRWRDGRLLSLAPREAQLLQVLSRRQGLPGTKMELLLDLGWRQEGRTPPFLELVVSRLRARLRAELGDEAAQALQTRRGAGYAWRPECPPERV